MKPQQSTYNTGFDRMALVPPKVPNIDQILEESFTGKLIAWDPVKQEEVWAQSPGRPSGTGTLSTAGGLVFQGGGDQEVLAYNAATGEQLWSADAQTVASGTPITYSIDGTQYIAIAVGFGGGLGAEAGAVSHAWKIKNRSRVLVYKLGGNHSLPPIEEEAEKILAEPLPVTATDEVVAAGQVLYQRHCSFCHGDGLRTSGLTPDLRYSAPAIHNIWKEIIIDGALRGGGMVSFAKYLTPEEAETIRQYVLSEANWLYQEQRKLGGHELEQQSDM